MKDGRRVWVMGEGAVADVTAHPATAAMVAEYAAWYDRHLDPAWRDVLLTTAIPPDASTPVWAVVPRDAADLRRMGRCFSSTLFLSAGNVTHTPAYGHLVALGLLASVQQAGHSQEQVERAAAYRQSLAATGRFLAFSVGVAPIGHRLRADPAARPALRVVKETTAGVVLRGKIGMHTSPAFADDVYIGQGAGVIRDGRSATFIVPVSSPGVTVTCRKVSARHANRFLAPLSSRFDELDGQMWLDDVFVPWERVFCLDPHSDENGGGPAEVIARWLFWHQLHAWLARAEFTLGLALACTDVMGLRDDSVTIEHLVDLLEVVQTVRSCLTAAELEPDFSAAGSAIPGQLHVAAGSLAMIKGRQRMSEILRALPGSSLVAAPADSDIHSAEVAAGLEEAFGGGGYTALQRSALLQLAWDHVSSSLDGRESAFELHGNGGLSAFRGRLRRHFDRYNELANGVLTLLDTAMPAIDLAGLRQRALAERRRASPR